MEVRTEACPPPPLASCWTHRAPMRLAPAEGAPIAALATAGAPVAASWQAWTPHRRSSRTLLSWSQQPSRPAPHVRCSQPLLLTQPPQPLPPTAASAWGAPQPTGTLGVAAAAGSPAAAEAPRGLYLSGRSAVHEAVSRAGYALEQQALAYYGTSITRRANPSHAELWSVCKQPKASSFALSRQRCHCAKAAVCQWLLPT